MRRIVEHDWFRPLLLGALAAMAIGQGVAAAGPSTPAPPPPPTPTMPATDPDVISVGTSVEGRAISATRRGDPTGRRVLVIGVIHGDEQAGRQIVGDLATLAVPDGVDLYLIDAMNPDGVAADRRTNSNGVDLNRNFPYDWGPIAEPGDWQYAGTGPASEPETSAVVTFIATVRPDLVIWYHQDANSIAPGQGRAGAIRQRYAELTGLPVAAVTGGTYTGVAATWARHELERDDPPGVAFIVELGATLSDDEALVHANAVLTIASEDN